MNTEDFVTYEQALALKKLGFREKCLYHYGPDGVIYDNCYICNELFQYVLSCELCMSYNEKELNGLCDAPTLTQVQKWLRKEKELYVEPNFCTPVFNVMLKSIPYTLYKRMEEKFSSYEEALSAGITKCINLLNNK